LAAVYPDVRSFASRAAAGKGDRALQGAFESSRRARGRAGHRGFKERENHPLKQWKLSPVDRESLDKWDEYTRAKEAMFLHIDTSGAQWTVLQVRLQEARSAIERNGA
jgi:hypothetical protein